MRKNITIAKRQPLKCIVCGDTNVEFMISYRDPMHPGEGPQPTREGPQPTGHKQIMWPTASLQSCAKCLEVAVYKLMKDQNLLNAAEVLASIGNE